MQHPNRATLRFTDTTEVEQTLLHALQFDGRKAFKTSGEMTAKITAAHLVAQLARSGFVIMKKPPSPPHRAPPYGPDGKMINEGS